MEDLHNEILNNFNTIYENSSGKTIGFLKAYSDLQEKDITVLKENTNRHPIIEKTQP